jgi:hypothetical protein
MHILRNSSKLGRLTCLFTRVYAKNLDYIWFVGHTDLFFTSPEPTNNGLDFKFGMLTSSFHFMTFVIF